MKSSFRIDDELMKDLNAICTEKGASLTSVVEQALKCYRDRYYMEEKATIINEEILNIIAAQNAHLLQQINNKSNRVISELAIQGAITNMILAAELEVNDIDLTEYRKRAVEFLKTNNRPLRLDELVS